MYSNKKHKESARTLVLLLAAVLVTGTVTSASNGNLGGFEGQNAFGANDIKQISKALSTVF